MTSADRDRYGLRPKVGDVDGDATTRLEFAHAFGEDLGEHVQIVKVAGGNVTLPEGFLVFLAREVRRRCNH